ncbi:MAG: hypothetical protein P8X69_04615 [Maritimibacter sp.]
MISIRATPPPVRPIVGITPSRTQSFSAIAVGQSIVGCIDSGMPATELIRTGASTPQPPGPGIGAIACPRIAATPHTDPPLTGARGVAATRTSRSNPAGR